MYSVSKIVEIILFSTLWWMPTGYAMENRRGEVEALAVSHDGKIIAANDGARVFLSDARDGRVLASLTGHGGSWGALAVSPDGSLIASGGQSVEVRDAATGTLLYFFTKPSGYFGVMAFSPDGKTLAAAGASKLHEDQPGTPVGIGVTSYQMIGEVRIWDLGSGRLLRVLRGDANEQRGRFNDFPLLAFISNDDVAVGGAYIEQNGSTLHGGAIELWDVRTGKAQRIYDYPWQTAASLGFSRDRSTLAVADRSETNVFLWKFQEPLQTENAVGVRLQGAWNSASGRARAMAFSSDGSTLAVAGKNLALWDISSQKQTEVFETMPEGASAVAFSPDGNRIVIGGAQGALQIIDARNGAVLRAMRGNGVAINALAFLPGGWSFACSDRNGALKLCDIQTGGARWSTDANNSVNRAVAFSPDDKFLASSSDSGVASMWNVRTRRRVRSFQIGAPAVSVALAARGSRLMLATANWRETQEWSEGEHHYVRYAGEVKLWNALDGTLMQALPDFDQWVWSIAFSPDASTLLVAGESRALGLWDIGARRWRWKIDFYAGTGSAVFSPDGRFVFTSRWNGVEERDVRDGKLMRRLVWPGVSLDKNGYCIGGTESVGLSPDGKWLAVYGWRRVTDDAQNDENGIGEVRIWNARSGQLKSISQYPHWKGRISFLNNEQLVIGSGDGVLQIQRMLFGSSATVLYPLWKVGGAYRGLGND